MSKWTLSAEGDSLLWKPDLWCADPGLDVVEPGMVEHHITSIGRRGVGLPRGSYPTPFLGYLVLWLGSPI